jgi:hypothetical protein
MPEDGFYTGTTAWVNLTQLRTIVVYLVRIFRCFGFVRLYPQTTADGGFEPFVPRWYGVCSSS